MEYMSDIKDTYNRSFFDLLEDGVLSEKATAVLKMRLQGATLEEIGRHYGHTRERIRQIISKAMVCLTNKGHMYFEEDKYSYFFKTYAFDKDWFITQIEKQERVWHYLSVRYEQGNKELSKALDDLTLSPELRQIIDSYMYQ